MEQKVKEYSHVIIGQSGTNPKPNIDGVYVADLKIFTDERGSVMKMVEDTDKTYLYGHVIARRVEEIYFSTVNPGVVKAWHGHKKMTLNYACVLGEVMIGLCDLRVGKTFGNTMRVHLDTIDNYKLLTVPPGVWNGYRSMNNKPAMIVNAASLTYSDSDIERIHPRDFPIDFDWGPYEVAG